MKFFLNILMTLILFMSYSQKLVAQFKVENNFKPDQCTNFPSGNWGHCCFEHDLVYWVGGTFTDRKKADSRLMSCVNRMKGPGYLMYEGVRMFGSNYWGAAWGSQNRVPLTSIEKELVLSENKLWNNLGRPNDFDFINFETSLFEVITPYHKLLVNKYLQSYSKTAEYQQFLQVYTKNMGTRPVSEKLYEH